MRRVPKEVIKEEVTDDVHYSTSDAARFQGGAKTGMSGGGGLSYDWQEITNDEVKLEGEESAPPKSRLAQYKPTHKCEGCATGACRRRKLPISGIHDIHDGDTASTSGSIMTNSVIDKSEFPDRDIDFDDWEDDNDSSAYVTMGSNGKVLRG